MIRRTPNLEDLRCRQRLILELAALAVATPQESQPPSCKEPREQTHSNASKYPYRSNPVGNLDLSILGDLVLVVLCVTNGDLPTVFPVLLSAPLPCFSSQSSGQTAQNAGRGANQTSYGNNRDAMLKRHARRNDFFHSNSLLDLNENHRNGVESFCDLLEYDISLNGCENAQWRSLPLPHYYQYRILPDQELNRPVPIDSTKVRRRNKRFHGNIPDSSNALKECGNLF